MPRSTAIFLLVLAVLASLLGYNYFARPFASYEAVMTESNQPELKSGGAEATDSASTTKTLSDQDLVQLIAFSYSLDAKESSQSALLSWIGQHQPGVVTLFGRRVSTESARVAIDSIKSEFDQKSSPLIAVDHEGGTVQRLSGSGFTNLPSWQALCVTNDTKRKKLLAASAREVSQVGVELVLAPMVDVASRSAVLKNRICSADAKVVESRAVEFINIFAEQKIISVIKHYPGIGSISRDLHSGFDQIKISEGEILIFKDLLQKYPLLGVMTAHVGVMDHYEDQPCSLNRDCIDDLTNYFPNTLVFTDALDMKSAGYAGQNKEDISLGERAVLAIKAGNDVLVFGPDVLLSEFDQVLGALRTAYDTEPDFRQQAEKSVKKIRQYKQILRQ